jgi:hypothetical protein
MGTNFYAEVNHCDHCGRFEELHIGKSSAGWCFSLHVIPEENLNSLEDWKELLSKPSTKIRDEYGSPIPLDELLNRITNRSWKNIVHDDIFMRQNHAVDGPNGLLRHQVGPYCVGHGEGTWDLIPGEFS